MAATAIDGVNAHLLEVVIRAVADTQIAHVDGVPHGRVFADVAPQHAHLLRGLQYLDCPESV